MAARVGDTARMSDSLEVAPLKDQYPAPLPAGARPTPERITHHQVVPTRLKKPGGLPERSHRDHALALDAARTNRVRAARSARLTTTHEPMNGAPAPAVLPDSDVLVNTVGFVLIGGALILLALLA